MSWPICNPLQDRSYLEGIVNGSRRVQLRGTIVPQECSLAGLSVLVNVVVPRSIECLVSARTLASYFWPSVSRVLFSRASYFCFAQSTNLRIHSIYMSTTVLRSRQLHATTADAMAWNPGWPVCSFLFRSDNRLQLLCV